MAAITFALFLVAYWVSATAKANPAQLGLSLSEDPVNPGSCDTQSHGQIKLIKDRLGDECLVVCSKNARSISAWKFLDGRSTVGEYFDPAYDCSDVVDRVPAAKDGVYWIKNEAVSNVVKAWCDVTTDGGGYLLVAKKDGPTTWTVPSSNETVQPFGNPHWSSIFGDMKMLDIRIQFSTTSEFQDTKADWSFRLANKRPFGELLVRNYGGCSGHNPGIGDVSYVKDLLLGKIVNTNFRCSLFSGHVSEGIGWAMMNKCLKMPCSNGYAIIKAGPPGYEINLKLDDHGSFSYSAYNNARSSGLLYSSTSFIGCSDTKCCACYGPKGGTKNYCLVNCTAINGGTVTKNVHAWIWIRSSVPKRVWRKCTEYIKTDVFGRKQKYRINEETGIAEKGSCAYSEEVKKSGSVLVAPNEKAVKKIPSAPGLLLYRSSDKKLFIQEKNGWNQIAMEKEINQIIKNQDQVLKEKIKRLENRIEFFPGCRFYKLLNPSLSNGIHMINNFQAYCDMTNGGWTLIARFSNSDSENWISNGNFWYDRMSSFDHTTHLTDNRDMISEAFWKVTGNEFKITRSDDSSHTALLQTTSNCLQGRTFRSKITSYGNFRNGTVWASDQCRGNCLVSYGGQYKTTAGFERHSCGSNIQSSNYIGFWCDWSNGDGAVMMIGGGGSACQRADHGIGITEQNEAQFGRVDTRHDFGNINNFISNAPTSYSLNLWVR